MDNAKLTAFMESIWESEILPTLTDYIRIPNKSPAFDKDWVGHGHMENAVALMEAWARASTGAVKGAVKGASRQVAAIHSNFFMCISLLL